MKHLPLAVTFGATVLFSAPFITATTAHVEDQKTRTPAGARESNRHALLQRHLWRLQEQLPVGHTESFYRDRLADHGWRITAVNQDEPMYIEYEIVRGDLTAEVQMKLDRETDQTIQVAVLENPIMREATEMELARNQYMTRLADTEGEGVETTPWWDTREEDRPPARRSYAESGRHKSEQGRQSDRVYHPFSDRDRVRMSGYSESGHHKSKQEMVSGHAYHPFSDRDRVRMERMAGRGDFAPSERTDQRVSLNDPNYVLVITPVLMETGENRSGIERMVRDLEALPVGQNKRFYRSTLQDRGYRIFDAASRGNRTQFGVEKDGHRALLSLWFDRDSGTSTQVDAFPLLLHPTPHVSSPTADIARRLDTTRHMAYELESLPVGQDSQFYRRALRERGYRITGTKLKADRTRFSAERDGQEIILIVKLDEETGKSTDVKALTKGEQPRQVSQMFKSRFESELGQ
jgi:hypothetical protein